MKICQDAQAAMCAAQIINAMGGQIEKQQDNNGCLSYWLSNTVTLLYLLQRNIKPASGGAYNARLRSPGSRSAPSPVSLKLFVVIRAPQHVILQYLLQRKIKTFGGPY